MGAGRCGDIVKPAN